MDHLLTMASDSPRSASLSANNSSGSYELVLSPVIFGLLGWWVDGLLGTRPLVTVIAAVFALVAAGTKIYLEYTESMRRHADDRRRATVQS